MLASHRGGPGSRTGSMWGLWWTKWHWGRFSPRNSVSPANHSTNFSIIIITRGWHNRPLSGCSVEWTLIPPPTVQIKKNSVWLRAGWPRGQSWSLGRFKNFLFMESRPAVGSTQPPIQWVPGALSPWVKRPGREADHSPPASAEVKKLWIYTSTPPYAFMA
jgi:hypothetical protein